MYPLRTAFNVLWLIHNCHRINCSGGDQSKLVSPAESSRDPLADMMTIDPAGIFHLPWRTKAKIRHLARRCMCLTVLTGCSRNGHVFDSNKTPLSIRRKNGPWLDLNHIAVASSSGYVRLLIRICGFHQTHQLYTALLCLGANCSSSLHLLYLFNKMPLPA